MADRRKKEAFVHRLAARMDTDGATAWVDTMIETLYDRFKAVRVQVLAIFLFVQSAKVGFLPSILDNGCVLFSAGHRPTKANAQRGEGRRKLTLSLFAK